MNHNKLFYLTLLIFITCGSILLAQKNIESQHLLWTGYSLKLKINDDYQLREEFEERTYWFPWRQHQFISRTVLERKLAKGWSTGVGFSYFLQSFPQDPEISEYYNRTELRPQLELVYVQDLFRKVSLNHRYWGEFRFFEQPGGSFDYGNIRARYKLELRYNPIPDLTLKAFDEIHLNIGGKIVQNVFDQNRYGTGVQYMFLDNLGVELSCFNWFQQRATGIDFYNRNIIRLTIHHRLALKNN